MVSSFSQDFSTNIVADTMVVVWVGEEMNKLFEHARGVVKGDSYIKAMDKVAQGIKRLTNQAKARSS